MTSRPIAAALLLGLGLATGSAAHAQDWSGRGPYRPRLTPQEIDNLQPGMRTMIQQGGIEPGPLLGYLWPGRGYAAGFYDGYASAHAGPYAGPYARPVYGVRPVPRRHARTARRHFAM